MRKWTPWSARSRSCGIKTRCSAGGHCTAVPERTVEKFENLWWSNLAVEFPPFWSFLPGWITRGCSKLYPKGVNGETCNNHGGSLGLWATPWGKYDRLIWSIKTRVGFGWLVCGDVEIEIENHPLPDWSTKGHVYQTVPARNPHHTTLTHRLRSIKKLLDWQGETSCLAALSQIGGRWLPLVFSHLKRLAWSNKTLYQETCLSALPLHKQTPETPAGCAIYCIYIYIYRYI